MSRRKKPRKIQSRTAAPPVQNRALPAPAPGAAPSGPDTGLAQAIDRLTDTVNGRMDTLGAAVTSLTQRVEAIEARGQVPATAEPAAPAPAPRAAAPAPVDSDGAPVLAAPRQADHRPPQSRSEGEVPHGWVKNEEYKDMMARMDRLEAERQIPPVVSAGKFESHFRAAIDGSAVQKAAASGNLPFVGGKEFHGARTYLPKHPKLRPAKGCDDPTISLSALQPMIRSLASRSSDPMSIGTELAGYLRPFYRPELVRELDTASAIVDLLPRTNLNGAREHIYTRETDASYDGYVMSKLAAGVTSGAGATATFEEVDGFMAGATVKFFTSAEGTQSAVILSIDTGTKVVTFTGTLNFNALTGDRVTSDIYTATAENADKPHGLWSVENVSQTVQTMATLLAITEQALNSVDGLQAFLQGEMTRRAREVLAWHILYGSGSAGQLQGLSTFTGVQTHVWSTDSEAGDTRVDAVLDAALQIRGGGQKSLVINETDWVKMLKRKGVSDGHYLNASRGAIGFINLPTMKAIGTIMVFFDEAVAEDDFFLGDWARAATIADQNRSSFMAGWVNDQFRKNQLTLRYEEHLDIAVLRTTSYVVGDWDSQP